jgi:dTDP-4-dehydrorhamnose 3,5-epimerase
MQSDTAQQAAERERIRTNSFLVMDKELRLKTISGNADFHYPMSYESDVNSSKSSMRQLISPYPQCFVGTIKSNQDDRGQLTELFRPDDFPFGAHRGSMGYISTTKPLVRRGPHEHKAQADCFFFLSGAFTLELWDNRDLYLLYDPVKTYQRFDGLGGNVTCFAIIPPGVVHSYTNLSHVEGSVINLPDKLYKGYGRHEAVDEIRHEIDPETIFVSRVVTGLLTEP